MLDDAEVDPAHVTSKVSVFTAGHQRSGRAGPACLKRTDILSVQVSIPIEIGGMKGGKKQSQRRCNHHPDLVQGIVFGNTVRQDGCPALGGVGQTGS